MGLYSVTMLRLLTTLSILDRAWTQVEEARPMYAGDQNDPALDRNIYGAPLSFCRPRSDSTTCIPRLPPIIVHGADTCRYVHLHLVNELMLLVPPSYPAHSMSATARVTNEKVRRTICQPPATLLISTTTRLQLRLLRPP